MRLMNEMVTELVDVQFTTRAEARIALDRLDEIAAVEVDIVRARIARGDVAYELLIHGPARDVRQALRECAEWSPATVHLLARAG